MRLDVVEANACCRCFIKTKIVEYGACVKFGRCYNRTRLNEKLNIQLNC